MKKIFIIPIALVLFLTAGCTFLGISGKYLPGTYFGYNEETGYTATLFIDNGGKIAGLVLDSGEPTNCTTETLENGTEAPYCEGTTKRILGTDYGLKDLGYSYEWFEQANLFGEQIIKEQGLDWVEFRYMDNEGNIVETMPDGQNENDRRYIDSIDGVTIDIVPMYYAVEDALKQAEK